MRLIFGRKSARRTRFPQDLRAYKFNDDLSHYIGFCKATDGSALTPDTVDFEDFMRFLDVEHYLGLRGSKAWSEDGNEGIIVAKFLIGKILARHVNALKEVPELYLEFARRLTLKTSSSPSIMIHYSSGLSMPSANLIAYFLPATRMDPGVLDVSRNEVVIFKVHGSIDWFDRSEFERQIAQFETRNESPPEDIIFSHAAALGLECVVDGPRHETDPLKNVYRAKNLQALYAKDLLFRATPRILPPSAAKLLYTARLHDFWQGMGDAGYYNYGMAIIGFSLPHQDEYARQILYEWVTNYQQYSWEKETLGQKKTPLAIIDFFPNGAPKTNFIERYRLWIGRVLISAATASTLPRWIGYSLER